MGKLSTSKTLRPGKWCGGNCHTCGVACGSCTAFRTSKSQRTETGWLRNLVESSCVNICLLSKFLSVFCEGFFFIVFPFCDDINQQIIRSKMLTQLTYIVYIFSPRKCSRYLSGALNSPVAVEAHAKSTAIARHFASRFNSRLRALCAEPASLLFVPCFVYEVEGHAPENEPTCFAAERYLPGVFLKYNSNSGYVADALLPHNDMVQAFLHFSFIRELQGVKG